MTIPTVTGGSFYTRRDDIKLKSKMSNNMSTLMHAAVCAAVPVLKQLRQISMMKKENALIRFFIENEKSSHTKKYFLSLSFSFTLFVAK